MLQLTKETIPLLSFIKSDFSFSRVLIKIADIVQLTSSNQIKIRVSIDSGEDFHSDDKNLSQDHARQTSVQSTY